ncbi:hypothetical protein [Haloferax massiliensis]|uniref:hypothetical protein n=1 Tax=Haloferax massiliensis TaxID=1476858 RepID=UPI001D00C995|nr:hypothetical protein [Haloferax massiliensis]
MHDLLTEADSERAHQRWLESEVAALFNESSFYPYTSLKYHTLLTAALVYSYEIGYSFEDLALIVDDPTTTIPHRTIFTSERFNLRLAASPNSRPYAPLGDSPQRSWATIWQSLNEHPLETATNRWQMVLDSNLRRIRSWSTALQYIEDFEAWGARP